MRVIPVLLMAMVLRLLRASRSGSSSLSKLFISSLPSETLYILDGTAMIYRSFYSKNALMHADALIQPALPSTSSPIACGALITMCSHFARVVERLQPKYLVVAFDARGKTFRNDLFAPYKQHRTETPQELLAQFGYCAPLLEALGVKCYQAPGFEADDVIASLTQWGREKGLNVVIVSEDKDMLQLVDTGVHILKNVYDKDLALIGEGEIVEKYGVDTSQLVDYFALIGDAADNIPGMKGVGPVMAQALLRHFTSFSSLEEAYHTLSPEAFEQELMNCFSSPLLPLASSPSPPPEGKKKRIISAARVVKLLSATDFSLIRTFQDLIALRRDILHIEPACAERCKKEGIVELAALSTGHFRYTGELIQAEEQLLGVSPSLALPLQALRRTYHTLDRIK